MPTCHRPEMLALTLEKLRNAKYADSPNIDVRIFLDKAPDSRLEELSWIRDSYYPCAEIFRTRERPDVPSGCWNILHSLKQGYLSNSELIFIVEEDIFVRPNFFEWHFENQTGEYFATCGRKLKQWRRNFYSNPGSCFRRDKLKLVVPHINDRFFQDTKGYMDRFFGPNDQFGILDDGLIQRVQQASGLLVKYPDEPVVAHQGFRMYGMTEEWRAKGQTIEDRIVDLRRILANLNPHERYLEDYEPY